jgi:putative hydrolase of HD superfamily
MREKDSFLDIISFISYIDQLKGVMRKNGLHDGSRSENTAEHSWHAAFSAFLLAQYANQPIEINKVIQMLLIHDLVEIEAGDTFVYDQKEVLEQDQAEAKAAMKVFGRLPEEPGRELRALWEEFEARETPEAKFAKAIDRFLPLYSNIINKGYSWQPYSITQSQVKEIASIIQDGSTKLWNLVEEMLDNAVDEGYLNP